MKKTLYSIYDTDEEMSKDLLGGKGYNLSVMAKEGINVPKAVIIPTEICRKYSTAPKTTMKLVESMILPKIVEFFRRDDAVRSLVSVRSGAKFSMPGMMDTILNVGLDAYSYPYWEKKLGVECVANCHDRLLDTYGEVVLGKNKGDMRGDELPDAHDQLLGAIEAVFKSWNNERAKTYRELHKIPHDLGTAVVIQEMVFGNLGTTSCTGVLFTRNPSTGENEIVGEFLPNAQGEDVVAGTSTPFPLEELIDWNEAIANELVEISSKLENHYCDMQDIEFTVQDGKLYILQTRSGKRTAKAAIKIAVDLYDEGIVDARTCVSRVTYQQYQMVTQPSIDPAFTVPPHCVGLPASNGLATGIVVFTSQDAVNCTEPCILVTAETTPDDISGINAAVGILTSTGGATSHAAVVARGMDKVCVVGCDALKQRKDGWGVADANGVTHLIQKGTKITLDGSTGHVWINTTVPLIGATKSPEIDRIRSILREAYNYLRVTGEVSTLPKKGGWFATYLVEDQPDMLKILSEVAAKMESGVIDLTSRSDLLSGADALLNAIFHDPTIASNIYTKKAHAIVSAVKTAKPEISVIMGKATAFDRTLVAQKFSVVRVVNDFGSLLDANGRIIVDDAALVNLNKEQVKKLLTLKKHYGETFVQVAATTDPNPSLFTPDREFGVADDIALQAFLGK